MKFENIVIGEILVHPRELFAYNDNDWKENEKSKTLFTDERFLPKLLVMAGVAPSISEIRRNNKSLMKTLDDIDFIRVKWGKKIVHIAVGK